MPKPLVSLHILITSSILFHEECTLLLLLLGTRNSSQDVVGLHWALQMTVASSHGICSPSPAALLGGINIKLGLKSLPQFQWIQMTDQASSNYTKSFQSCSLWDMCQWDQLLHHGYLCKCYLPKRFQLNEQYDTMKLLYWSDYLQTFYKNESKCKRISILW